MCVTPPHSPCRGDVFTRAAFETARKVRFALYIPTGTHRHIARAIVYHSDVNPPSIPPWSAAGRTHPYPTSVPAVIRRHECRPFTETRRRDAAK